MAWFNPWKGDPEMRFLYDQTLGSKQGIKFANGCMQNKYPINICVKYKTPSVKANTHNQYNVCVINIFFNVEGSTLSNSLLASSEMVDN